MADIPQVLATYDALVGVALGVGLTYGFGALNRRHQEAREDQTRWYNARREAYAALFTAALQLSRSFTDEKGLTERANNELTAAMGAVRLVGSPAAIEAADNLYGAVLKDAGVLMQELFEIMKQLAERPEEEVTAEDMDILEERFATLQRSPPKSHLPSARAAFEEAARRDLGHP